jgi:hypothetical protein
MRDVLLCCALTGTTLMLQPSAALASKDSSAPCAGHLQQLGYREVAFEARHSHSSLYEARRGHEEVKVMVKNGSCAVQQVWLDD